MFIDWTPQYLGGYDNLIPTQSPYYINITAPIAPVLATNYYVYIWVWDGSATAPTNQHHNYVIRKPIINREFSLTVNISDYIRPFIRPVIHDITDWQDYDDGAVFVCYKVMTYSKDNVLLTTENSLKYVATCGWRWSEDTKFNKPEYDSNMRYLEYFVDGDELYKTHYKLPMSSDGTKITYEYFLNPTVTSTNGLVVREVNTELTESGCLDYELLYTNRLGFWEWFPMNGKVTVNSSSSMSTFKRNTVKSNIPSIFPSRGAFGKKSTKTYVWNSSILDDSFYIKYEEIIESPNIIIYNTKTGQKEYVNVLSSNYSFLSVENNRNNLSYSIEFTCQSEKIKIV